MPSISLISNLPQKATFGEVSMAIWEHLKLVLSLEPQWILIRFLISVNVF